MNAALIVGFALVYSTVPVPPVKVFRSFIVTVPPIFIVPPLVMSIEPLRADPVVLPTIRLPEIVSTEPLLKEIVAVELLLLTFNVNEAQAAVPISTVTVIPPLMVTVSAEVGTAAPPQVAVLLQLPVTEATL